MERTWYTPNVVDTTKSKRKRGRTDGRAWNQLRPIYVDLGGITQASGSAYIEIEHTKVACAIYGPKPRQDVEFSDEGTVLCDFRYAPFARRIKPERYVAQAVEKAFAQLVLQAVESSIQLKKLPKSVVEIYIMVLQADGGELGAAITATSLALASAGIELFGLITVASVAAMQKATPSEAKETVSLWLDPTYAEEEESTATLLLAILTSSQEVTQIWQEKTLDASMLAKAIALASDGAKITSVMMRKRLLSYFKPATKHMEGHSS